MVRSELMDLINYCELNYHVDSWIIENVHVWPLIRNDLFFNNSDEFRLLCSSNQKTTKKIINTAETAVSFLKYISIFCRDYKKKAEIYKEYQVVFLSDGISFTLLKNFWYDRFCDPIIDRLLEYKIRWLHLVPLRKYLVPRYRPSVFIQPKLDLIRVVNNIFSKRSNYQIEWILEFKEMIIYLKNFKDEIVLPNIDSIKKYTFIIKCWSDYFKNILRKVNASVGLLVSYYSLTGMAFNLACNELSIPSIDIQHGLQGELHVAYGRFENVPDIGYELLPSIFWCWSNFETEIINKWCINKISRHRSILGGNLFLESWREGNKNSYVKYYDKKIIKLKKKYENTKHILFSLSGNEEIDKLDMMIRLIKNTRDNYCWWLRLHPCFLTQHRNIMNILNRHNLLKSVQIYGATKFPLYAILRHMDVHVTSISSVVIEAEKFRVPSVIFQKLGSELFYKQVLSGWAMPAYAEESILSAIETQINKRECLVEESKGKSNLSTTFGIKTLLDIVSK